MLSYLISHQLFVFFYDTKTILLYSCVILKGEWVFMVLGSHYSENLAGKWCSKASRWSYSPYLYINPAILYLINVYESLLEWVWVQTTKSFLGKRYFSNVFVLVFYG